MFYENRRRREKALGCVYVVLNARDIIIIHNSQIICMRHSHSHRLLFCCRWYAITIRQALNEDEDENDDHFLVAAEGLNTLLYCTQFKRIIVFITTVLYLLYSVFSYDALVNVCAPSHCVSNEYVCSGLICILHICTLCNILYI